MPVFLHVPKTDLEKTLREIIDDSLGMLYARLRDRAYRECAMAGRVETRQEIRETLLRMMQYR